MSNIISFNELISRLKNDEYNIIAFIVTPWHLLGVRALLERLKDEGKYKNHLICIMPHADTGYVFDPHNLPEDCVYLKEKKTPELSAPFFWKFFLLIRSQVSNSRNPLYIVSPWSYRINTSIYLSAKTARKIILCKVDEGVATYMKTSNPLYQSINNRNLKQFLNYFASKFLHLFINNKQNCNLLYYKNNELYPNSKIIPYYKKILCNNRAVTHNPQLILIATMAFSKEEVYNDEIAKKLEQIILFLTKNNYVCELKPHPREDNFIDVYSRYNIKIVDNKYSMEEYLIKSQPKCLISFSSTCLITAKLFYNIKPISVINFLDLENFSKKYYNEMNSFRKVFANIVSFPSSKDELIKEIITPIEQ